MCLVVSVYMYIYIHAHSPWRNANIFLEIVCVRWKRCAISRIYCSVKWLEIVLYSKINVSRDATNLVGNNFVEDCRAESTVSIRRREIRGGISNL